MQSSRRLIKSASLVSLVAVGSLLLSLVSSPSLRAQARITLQSLQAEVDVLKTQVAAIQTQVTSILGGEAPVGRTTASQSLSHTVWNGGPIAGRSLAFSKVSAASRLRITYSDHAWSGFAGNFHLDLFPQIDGQPVLVGGAPFRHQQYVGYPSSIIVHHISMDVLVPAGLAAGPHTLTISAVPPQGTGSAPTNFGSGYVSSLNDNRLPVLMQVEELP
jgi:hypothetical protein